MRDRTYVLILSVSILLSGLARGETQFDLAVPKLGYLFDPAARAVRPLMGVPGAALAGEPVAASYPLERALLPPSADWFLSVDPDRRQPALRRVHAAGVSHSPLSGVSPDPDRMALSPAGRSAALYYQDSGAVELMTGLPDAVRVRRIDLAPRNSISTAIAVSDDGARLLAAFPGLGLLAWSADSLERIPLEEPIAAAAFAPQSHAAAVAAASRIYLLQSLELRPLVAAGQWPSPAAAPPAGLALSRGARQLIAAYPDGTVLVMDTLDGASRTLRCHCRPTGVHPLQDWLFRLNDFTGGAVFLLDAAGAEPRLWFVPADRGGDQ